MNNILLNKVLLAQTKSGKTVNISVVGISMYPNLLEGDSISVKQFERYEVGDILIFIYKQDELLVHRLLKQDKHIYYCKGDNAFRLEDILHDQIVGRVTQVNGAPLSPCPPKLVALSYAVGRSFRKYRYDLSLTKSTPVYCLYKKVILNREKEKIMIYKKNPNMDYIQTDETSLAVFDPESGDTHFFDETGISILNILDDPMDMDGLLQSLCKLYSASPEDIRSDVDEFLEDTLSKKIIELL